MLISRTALAAALPATDSGDPTHPIFNKLELRPDGQVRSTNGHIAILAKDRHPMPDEDFPTIAGAPFHGTPEAPVLLDATTAKRLIAATKQGTKSLPILRNVQISRNGSDHTATIAATDLHIPTVCTIESVEGERMPDLDRVTPPANKPGTVVVIFSTEVLGALLQAAKAVEGKKHFQSIRFEIPIGRKDRQVTKGRPNKDTGETDRDVLGEVISPVRVTMIGEETEVIAVAMPCRI